MTKPATKPATKLFPMATERSYLAQIRKRMRLVRTLLEEEMGRDTPVSAAVWRVKMVLQRVPVAEEPLKRQANAAARFSTGVVDRETTKVLPQLAPAHAPAEVHQAAGHAALLTLQDIHRRTDAIQANAVRAVPVVAGQLDQWASNNANLITGLQQATLDKIADEVAAAVREGATTRDLQKVLTKQFGIADNRAKAIARDQVGTLNAQVTQERQTQLGVEWYEWSSSEDERVRPLHDALDGTIRRWDDPHPTEGHPGVAINCRCVAIPVLNPPTVPGDLTNSDILTQAAAMGPVPRDLQEETFEHLSIARGRGVDRVARVRSQLTATGVPADEVDRAILAVLDLDTMSSQGQDLHKVLEPLKTVQWQRAVPTTPDPAELTFKMHKLTDTDDSVLVEVSVAKLDAAWRASDPSRYISPGGRAAEGEVAGKYQRFQSWLEKNRGVPIEAPYVGFVGGVGFVDGRHRFAALRDQGVETIAISVDKSELGRIQSLQP